MTAAFLRICPVFFAVVVATTAAVGWQTVEACSCVPHLRSEIVPEPGEVGVPRNVRIRFTVGGSAATTIESRFVGSYVLRGLDVMGVDLGEIGTTQELIGNRVVITPINDLAPNSRFRLSLVTEEATLEITDFVTGGKSLRAMLKEFFNVSEKLDTAPVVASVVGLPGRRGSPACEGYTQGYLITIRVPIQINLHREHYDWLIEEIREDGSAVAVQRCAIRLKTIRAQWAEEWQEYRLVVGHPQCGSGPVPEPGSHVIVLSLVGVGEIAWTSDEIHVNVPEPSWPNNSFQRTRARGGRGPGPLNSNR